MRIGIDLGGTKIEVIALDGAGAVLMRHRVDTPAGDYEATLDAIAGLVALVETKTGRKGTVGVGSPGAISHKTGLLKNSNSAALNGRPLDRDIAARLGRPVRLANDANCFTLSEAVDGAAADAHVVFGVILGTGVGGGIAARKTIIGGTNGIAGEWGHNPLPWPRRGDAPARACYCGKTGCVETYLSGAGLTYDYKKLTGQTRTGQEIAAAALGGDSHAAACTGAYLDRLARGLASIVNILDPDAIVLGGGLSNIESLYTDLPARIGHHAFSGGISTPVLRAKYGDSSGVRGAAWLWPSQSVR
jgi:fructokinase